MLYSTSFAAAVLAFTSSVFAQTAGFAAMTVPTQGQSVAAGSILEITWLPSAEHTGAITIELLQGATPSTLEVGATIATSIDQSSGKYPWNVPANLPSFATYGFKITLDSTKSSANPIFQYSFPFQVTGLPPRATPAAPGPGYPVGDVATIGLPPSATPASPGPGYPVGDITTVQLSKGPSYSAKPTTSSVSTMILSTSSIPVAAHLPSAPPPALYPVASAPAKYPVASAPAKYPVASVPAVHPTANTTRIPSATGTGGAPVGTSTLQTVVNNSASGIARCGLAVAAGMVLALVL